MDRGSRGGEQQVFDNHQSIVDGEPREAIWLLALLDEFRDSIGSLMTRSCDEETMGIGVIVGIWSLLIIAVY